jgi:hypothetical protein
LIEHPETNNSTAFVNRTDRRHDSKLAPTSLRNTLSIVLTLAPASEHRTAIGFDSAGFRNIARATASALSSRGNVTKVGIGDAF